MLLLLLLLRGLLRVARRSARLALALRAEPAPTGDTLATPCPVTNVDSHCSCTDSARHLQTISALVSRPYPQLWNPSSLHLAKNTQARTPSHWSNRSTLFGLFATLTFFVTDSPRTKSYGGLASRCIPFCVEEIRWYSF